MLGAGASAVGVTHEVSGRVYQIMLQAQD